MQGLLMDFVTRFFFLYTLYSFDWQTLKKALAAIPQEFCELFTLNTNLRSQAKTVAVGLQRQLILFSACRKKKGKVAERDKGLHDPRRRALRWIAESSVGLTTFSF